MIKILKSVTKYRGFRKEKITESNEGIQNPCRGMFDLHTFSVDEDPDFSAKKSIHSREVSLALVLIDIGAARERELNAEEIQRIDRIIRHFYDSGKDIILRIAYDHEGKGMEREPSFFKYVKEHAEQVSKLIKEYPKQIFIYQGLLIGQWGEMHTSRFTSDERLAELYGIFDENRDKRTYLAVRRPVQWRKLKAEQAGEEQISTGGLGIFNDGMFGSDSDLGTFDSTSKNRDNWNRAWNRNNELEFEGKVADTSPLGGEALFGEGFFAHNDPETYISELRKIKATYLNRNHDIRLINEWKQMTVKSRDIWNGKSYFEYIEAHLGYRFVVKNADVYKTSEGFKLEITISNEGFARIYRNTELFILFGESEKTGTKIEIGTGILNGIAPGSEIVVEKEFARLTGKLYLSAKESISRNNIRFANTGAGDIGLLIGEML